MPAGNRWASGCGGRNRGPDASSRPRCLDGRCQEPAAGEEIFSRGSSPLKSGSCPPENERFPVCSDFRRCDRSACTSLLVCLGGSRPALVTRSFNRCSGDFRASGRPHRRPRRLDPLPPRPAVRPNDHRQHIPTHAERRPEESPRIIRPFFRLLNGQPVDPGSLSGVSPKRFITYRLLADSARNPVDRALRFFFTEGN